REPTVMWWPGKIPADTRCSVPAMTIDILPTIAHLTGAELPQQKIDGKNIWPLISGEDGAESPQRAYFFYYGEQLQAMRMGRWKLHFPHNYRSLNGGVGGTGGKPTAYRQNRIELSLFDLRLDPGETTDVQSRFPDVVARMNELAEEMRQDLGDTKKFPGTGKRQPGRVNDQ
ncbi:MAG: sulfatase/phosphatase domain-containing protein, partial [Pirellulaceae bacterium]